MPRPNAKLLDLMVKVDRAYKHLVDLRIGLDRFWGPPYPYEIVPEDDSQTGQRAFCLRVHKEIPAEFSALIGDIVHNLRDALDHLAWHMVQASPVTPKAKEKQIYFPIFEDASGYRSGKLQKIRGMTDAAIQAIDDLQPYGRVDQSNPMAGAGNLALYWLSAINIQDKHRLLIPVLTSAPALSITKSKRVEMANVLRAAFGSENAPVMVGLPVIPGIPLKDGSILCTLPITEVDEDMKFRLQIAFGDPTCVRGKEIISTLDNMHRIVKNIMVVFDAKGLL